MLRKTISVIALSNRDFPNFAARQTEVVRWMKIAKAQGADLAVLPEAINLYKGDGFDNPNAMTFAEAALDDWKKDTAMLFEAAVKLKIAVTIPVVIREGKHLTNSFFLVSKTGKVLGRYDKLCPTLGELEENVKPGTPHLIDWEGIKVGGAICFDTNFLHVFENQFRLGAQFFLVCSLWPGGHQCNYAALKFSTPIAIAYPAWSRIIDIDGKELVAGGYRNETLRFGFGTPVYTATLNFDRAAFYSDFNQYKMAEIEHAYGRRVRIQYDQDNCVFLIESRAHDLTVRDIIERFALVSRQQYFTRYEQTLQRYKLKR